MARTKQTSRKAYGLAQSFIKARVAIWSSVLAVSILVWKRQSPASLILPIPDAGGKCHPFEPIVTLPSQVAQYSSRPTSHLKIHNETIQSWKLPDVHMAFLKKESLASHDGLYGIENYMHSYEGSVTYTWMSILNALKPDTHMVLDGGMNTGFYTTLTAVLGYAVHAFDIQLDCFDVASTLLKANGVKSRSHFYHMGLWKEHSTMMVQEGCDPGRGVDNFIERPASNDMEWDHRVHNISVIPLDSFFDSMEKKQAGLFKKKIAILKMDIEGAEISALQGLGKHHFASIENIIMEFAIRRLQRVAGSTKEMAKFEFQRLESAGFRSFLLYHPRIPKKDWSNEARMRQDWGTHVASSIHPIDDFSSFNTSLTNVITWKILDWDVLFTKACARGCNLLFTKTLATFPIA